MIPALRRWLRRAPLNRLFEPYARALNDHWARGRPVFFHIGSGRFFTLASSNQGFEPLERYRTLEEHALASCRGRVLDAGAGAGRHSILLHDAGLEVVSLEIEPTLVDLMKRRGLSQVHQGDVWDFEHGQFDTILFLHPTIGLAGNLDGLSELLRRLRARLTPRGQILLDSSVPRRTRSSQRYAGEVEMQLQYRALLGRPFPWLVVDFDVLNERAKFAGFQAELVTRGRDPRDYLARLTPDPSA